MSVGAMCRGNAVTLVMLILLNLALMSLSEPAWIALGLLGLLGAGWLDYRQGKAAGHDACGVRDTVRTISAEGGFGDSRQDHKYIAQAWSASNGAKALLLSALPPFAAGCLHIACVALNVRPMVLPSRVAAWLLSLPWWCTILHWQSTFDHLTPLSVAMLLVTPFLLPLCQYAGYMQGPALWARTETAMAEGRRRAKARSRVRRKPGPRAKGPEV